MVLPAIRPAKAANPGVTTHEATLLTDGDIRQALSAETYHAGLGYLAAGRVQNVHLLQDSGTIVGRVRGSKKTPYSVVIRLTRNKFGALTIANSCGCSFGRNCKHVAATLLAAAPQQRTIEGLIADEPAPPPEVKLWLQALQNAQPSESEDYPENIRNRLLYLLGTAPAGGLLQINPTMVVLRRDGTYSLEQSRHSPGQYGPHRQFPTFFRSSDRSIFRRLTAFGQTQDEEFIETLRRILATGRAHWGSARGVVLQQGEPISGTLTWRTLDDGTQRPALELPPGLLPLHLTEPWYADPTAGRLGPVQIEMAGRLLQAVLAAPAVEPEWVKLVCTELHRRAPGVAVPREVAMPPLISEPVQPVLSLFAAKLAPRLNRSAWSDPRQRQQAPTETVPVARLAFCYGPATLAPMPAAGGNAMPTHMIDGVLHRIRRDAVGEARAMTTMRRHGFLPTKDYHTVPTDLNDTMILMDADPAAWVDFVLDEMPALRAQGWTVNVSDNFPIRFATLSGEISAEIQEGSGIDWFDLELGAMVDGERIDLLPALLSVIRNEHLLDDLDEDFDEDFDQEGDEDGNAIIAGRRNALVTLPDGRLLPVPMAKLRPLLSIILQLFEGLPDDGTSRVRLPRFRLADLALAEAACADLVWRGGEALRALGRQLRDTAGIPAASLPPGFAATLRPYQSRGVDWLQFLRAAGLGGVLADEMGLGKTVQTLAHIAIEHASGRLDRPALVICPTSLVANWLAEAARFTPMLRVLALHGPDRRKYFSAIEAHDLVITTYPLLIRDHEPLRAQEWHLVILDEAQIIKNPNADTTKIATTLRGRQRLCLTGTPLENHLGELWSLFDFMMPSFLGAARDFQRGWRQPIERGGDAERRALLSKRITPFMLRRTKAEVASDLPPKTEIIEYVEMAQPQRAVYEGIRLTMHAKVKMAVAERGLSRSGIIILDALLKLRQACCDPRLLKLKTAGTARAKSAKLERLMEMLPELLEEGRRILLFSQFTSMLALIEEVLTKNAIPYALLTGETRDRATAIRAFTDGKVKLFLISLKAGGVGLNLTAADTVIHYDPWWNPAVEAQATDRAHRLGQDKPVFVHRMITRGTIEEKMEELKARKQALVAGILGEGDGRALSLSEQDIEDLFAPLPAS